MSTRSFKAGYHNIGGRARFSTQVKRSLLLFSINLLWFASFGQVTTNQGSGLAATYPSLADAITAVNAATISSPVEITLTANETAPSTGYVITASGTATNTIIINGGGKSVTAGTGYTAGSFTNAIFKLLGADWVTIENFTMQENSLNTDNSVATTGNTNTMTEWGVALLYATTTNGAQNCTIQNNTISLNASYPNTWGIYSNSAHSATDVLTRASPTTAAGNNQGLKVYGNTISNVNRGILVVGPNTATAFQTGIDIGGSSAATGNTITGFGAAGGNAFIQAGELGSYTYGILIQHCDGYNVSYNTITSANGTIAETYTGIQVSNSWATHTGTYTNSINNNSFDLYSAGTSYQAITGIRVYSSASSTSELRVQNNDFKRLDFSTGASALGTVSAIAQSCPVKTMKIDNNSFTNLVVHTGGSLYLIDVTVKMPADGLKEVIGNKIVGTLSKIGSGAGNPYTIGIEDYPTRDIYYSPSTAKVVYDNNDFSNITISGCNANSNAFVGIRGYDKGIKEISGNTMNNITIDNSCQGGMMGMMIANSSNGLISGNSIKNFTTANTIVGINNSITANASANDIFRGNIISGLKVTSAAYFGCYVIGMSIAQENIKVVEGNSVSDLVSEVSGATSNFSYGIAAGAANLTIRNNVVGNIQVPHSTAGIYGISCGAPVLSVDFNTVYLNASSDGAGNFRTTALSAVPTTNFPLRNNIIVNTSTPTGTGTAVAYSLSGAQTGQGAASDNNLYYVGTPSSTKLVFSGFSQSQTLQDFQTALGDSRESHSISEEPHFRNTTSGSAFLRIDSTASGKIDGGAKPISGITADIDGQARDVATPDIGADEIESASGLTLAGTLSDFSYCPSTPSDVQTFNVSGLGLTADVTVTPPAGFEIRKTGDTDFGSTVTLTTAADGSVAETSIDIRVAASATGNLTGNISATSGDFEETLAVTATATSNTYYNDSDNDGYSDGTTTTGCTAPSGYKLAADLTSMSLDCNDDDGNEFPGQKWYVDGDNDGYVGDSTVQCARPAGAFLKSELAGQGLQLGDCDDTNDQITNGTLWYVDSDGDGFYITVRQCTQPTGGLLEADLTAEQLATLDCNDDDADEFPGQQWYVDSDGDGYVADAGTACARPTSGYTLSELTTASKQTGDCDDSEAGINPATVWYLDADGDGYYTGSGTTSCTSPGTDYKYTAVQSGDCDDSDPALNPATLWYLDADGDGYYTGTAVTSCTSPGTGYTTTAGTAGDCDDTNSAINPATVWYKDADNDGYTDGSMLTQCSQPTNYKLASALASETLDCNDASASINPATVWYLDADGDGYYTGTGVTSCTSPGTGYTTTVGTAGDCDDSNASLTTSITWYSDADGDGYSDGTTQSTCTRPTGYKLSSELTATSGDCDDNNAALKPTTIWYKDADGDGYSDGSTQTQCTQPTNYYLSTSLTGTSGDCDDANAALNPATKWYKDGDGDGYSDGTFLTQCTTPTNYKLPAQLTGISGDCDDTNAAINPSSGGLVSIIYTGAYFSSTTNNSATVTLSATVKVPAGTDVTKSQVKFINRDNGQYITANWVNIGLVNQSDKTTGTATAQYTVSLSSTEDARQITIGMEVGGANSCFGRNNSDDNVVINISKPLGDFVTGGGFMVASSSGGLKAADNGSKTNFGFNAKYNKTFKNIQGNVNIIIRRTEGSVLKIYQVKSNNFSSLSSVSATATTPAQATVNGKAIIQDITTPNSPVSIDGNGTIQMTMTDLGEPGKYDVLGITVWNKDGGMWYASNWSGTKTVDQQIMRGNIQVNQPPGAVGKTPTSITLVSSTAISTLATTVTFTATINESDTKANPTGYVVFYDNGVLLSYAQISSASKAVLNTSALSLGSHSITAYYRGDTKFAASDNTVSQQVQRTLISRTIPLVDGTGDIAEKETGLKLDVLGNPSSTSFQVKLHGNNKETMMLRITDAAGKPRQVLDGLYNGQTLRIGATLSNGTYFVELIQGRKRYTVKLVKVS